MGYRINVVLTGSENIGEALKAMSEGKQVPYDEKYMRHGMMQLRSVIWLWSISWQPQ